MSENMRERERAKRQERQRQTDTHTHTHTVRHTARQRERASMCVWVRRTGCATCKQNRTVSHIMDVHCHHIDVRAVCKKIFACCFVWSCVRGKLCTHNNKNHIFFVEIAKKLSCRTYEWVMSHIRKSYITHANKSWRTFKRVMSHMQISHGAHLNESCHTCK